MRERMAFYNQFQRSVGNFADCATSSKLVAIIWAAGVICKEDARLFPLVTFCASSYGKVALQGDVQAVAKPDLQRPAFCPYQELPLSNAQAFAIGQKLV
jgi:hypothetical protein